MRVHEGNGPGRRISKSDFPCSPLLCYAVAEGGGSTEPAPRPQVSQKALRDQMPERGNYSNRMTGEILTILKKKIQKEGASSLSAE